MKTLFTTLGVLLWTCLAAQQADKKSVVIGSMTTKSNALLIVNPPNADQGVLLPQLSTGQRMSLRPSSPSEDGLIVFDTNFQTYYYWSNGKWTRLTAVGKSHAYYSIDPASFKRLQPAGNESQGRLLLFDSDNSFVTVTGGAPGEDILAPLELPHGATIEEVKLYYLDNDSRNLKVRLVRKNLSGSNEDMLTWESTSAAYSVRSETFNSFRGRELVDNENYTYRILIDFDVDPAEAITDPSLARQRIYGIRIKYQL
jgi:hypothetical protein